MLLELTLACTFTCRAILISLLFIKLVRYIRYLFVAQNKHILEFYMQIFVPQNKPSIVDFSVILAAFYHEVDMNFKKIICQIVAAKMLVAN